MTEILKKLFGYAFNLTVLFALVWGVSRRDENLITAESGLGYALGIIGAVLMLLLLIYPLRKRIRFISHFGTVKFWFRTHMLFGILGPVLILFHSNFQVGSLNSMVAMFCMLTVASSGLIGRFLYAKIHHGLYGSQIEMKELRENADKIEQSLSSEVDDNATTERLSRYSEGVFENTRSIISSIRMFLHTQIALRSTFRRELNAINEKLQAKVEDGNWNQPDYELHKKVAERLLTEYFRAIRRTASYRVSERLFSLWHMLHLPIFFMMLISAVVHVFVVHMY